MRHRLPFARPHETVGLFGGSFDPAHAGHVHVTREALKRFRLDRIWWLVSPGNPLKARGPAPLERRMAAARQKMQHPRVIVSDLESRIGTRYTAQTLEAVLKLYPKTRFVWLMGADNMAQFHRWDRWQWIMENIPLAIMARPGKRAAALHSVAADRYRGGQLPERLAGRLADQPAPAWCFVNMPMRAVSSSAIRARGDWPAT